MSLLDEASDRPVVITGAAGFIGFHIAMRLLREGRPVIGVDNLNSYYSIELKQARLDRLQSEAGFRFVRLDLTDGAELSALFQSARPMVVLHLAAQPGVRYSLINPQAYSSANLVGFVNILEASRQAQVKHLVYASTSSVYGASTKLPFSVNDAAEHPLSLYAATKRANELMAHSYSHLYGLPSTGLRFFTVYGPWGRPDMAPFLFTRRILGGEPIDVFAGGRLERDFTYIDDIVEGVRRVLDLIPQPDVKWSGNAPNRASSTAPYRIYNIGNNVPVTVSAFIDVLEEALGCKAVRRFLPMQPGDVVSTCADITDLKNDVGFAPRTPIEEGVPRFVRWYREFYRV
jgi:UDP-glucuronate 4-epimerase